MALEEKLAGWWRVWAIASRHTLRWKYAEVFQDASLRKGLRDFFIPMCFSGRGSGAKVGRLSGKVKSALCTCLEVFLYGFGVEEKLGRLSPLDVS